MEVMGLGLGMLSSQQVVRCGFINSPSGSILPSVGKVVPTGQSPVSGLPPTETEEAELPRDLWLFASPGFDLTSRKLATVPKGHPWWSEECGRFVYSRSHEGPCCLLRYEK